MSEAGGNGAAARLDELAAVTREYAAYSMGGGFAFVIVGAWLGVGALVRQRSLEWGNVLLAFAPVMFFELISVSRRYYQRRGAVAHREPLEGARAGHLLFTLVLAALAAARIVASQHRWARDVGAAGWLALAAAVTALLAVGIRAAACTRGSADSGFGYVLVLTAGGSFADRESGFWDGMILVMAALFALLGGYHHVRYRRLERRLAALRGTP